MYCWHEAHTGSGGGGVKCKQMSAASPEMLVTTYQFTGSHTGEDNFKRKRNTSRKIWRWQNTQRTPKHRKAHNTWWLLKM